MLLTIKQDYNKYFNYFLYRISLLDVTLQRQISASNFIILVETNNFYNY